jgi:predicted nucleic acid-binding protein
VLVPGVLDLCGVTRDPKDDSIVACAVEGEAQLIVSGDQDLLALDQYAGIRVLSPRAFLQELDPSAG